MPKLIATRGLPGCGKTTRARAWVAENPAGRARVNRDDTGAQLHGGRKHTGPTEQQITAVQHAAISALLKRGQDVVCDDTSLPSKVVRELRALAVAAGAEFEVWDMTDVPLSTCLERDAARTGPAHVGAEVINAMHARFIRGHKYPLPLPDEPADAIGAVVPYVARRGTTPTIMVDLDGTVALMNGRSPFDETRVGEDLPNVPVINVVRAMAGDADVIFCSGRTEGCRAATERWLAEHVKIPYVELFMRKVGDQRKDSIVKTEIFNEYIRDSFNIICVFDDRDQVVRAWRALGLTVMQVAEGNF